MRILVLCWLFAGALANAPPRNGYCNWGANYGDTQDQCHCPNDVYPQIFAEYTKTGGTFPTCPNNETRISNYAKAAGPTTQCCIDFRASSLATANFGKPNSCTTPTCGEGVTPCTEFWDDRDEGFPNQFSAEMKASLYGKPKGCISYEVAPACTAVSTDKVSSECDCYNLGLANRNETHRICVKSASGDIEQSLFGGGNCQFNCDVPQCNLANGRCDDANLTHFVCAAVPVNAQFECTYGSVSYGCAAGFYRTGEEVNDYKPCPAGYACPGGINCLLECEKGTICMPYKAARADWKAEGARVFALPEQEETKEEGDMVVSKEDDRTLCQMECPSNIADEDCHTFASRAFNATRLYLENCESAGSGRTGEERCESAGGVFHRKSCLCHVCGGAGNITQYCWPGHYCPNATTMAVCPAGSFCPEGTEKPYTCVFSICGRGQAYPDSTYTASVVFILGLVLAGCVWRQASIIQANARQARSDDMQALAERLSTIKNGETVASDPLRLSSQLSSSLQLEAEPQAVYKGGGMRFTRAITSALDVDAGSTHLHRGKHELVGLIESKLLPDHQKTLRTSKALCSLSTTTLRRVMEDYESLEQDASRDLLLAQLQDINKPHPWKDEEMDPLAQPDFFTKGLSLATAVATMSPEAIEHVFAANEDMMGVVKFIQKVPERSNHPLSKERFDLLATLLFWNRNVRNSIAAVQECAVKGDDSPRALNLGSPRSYSTPSEPQALRQSRKIMSKPTAQKIKTLQRQRQEEYMSCCDRIKSFCGYRATFNRNDADGELSLYKVQIAQAVMANEIDGMSQTAILNKAAFNKLLCGDAPEDSRLSQKQTHALFDSINVEDNPGFLNKADLSEWLAGSQHSQHKTFTIDIGFDELSLTLKKKKGVKVLDGVTGQLYAGDVTAVMGPSGAGKTTFLNTLSGKATYGNTSGKIYINGKLDSITNYAADIGFVPQEDTMLRNLSVKENLTHQAQLRLPRSLSSLEAKERVDRAIDMLGLFEIRHSLIGDETTRGISGGQRKRVNIGMELVADPTVLFLDEPTSGLDSSGSLEVMGALRKISQARSLSLCRSRCLPQTNSLVALKSHRRESTSSPYCTSLALRSSICSRRCCSWARAATPCTWAPPRTTPPRSTLKGWALTRLQT